MSLTGRFGVGSDGVARDKWPQNMAGVADEEFTPHNSIPASLEGIAEKTVVDKRRARVTDRTRRMGIFLRTDDDVQRPVSIKVYGFIKSCNLIGNGDWKGYVQIDEAR